MLWDLVLTSYTINSLPVCCSTNELLKTWLGKAKFFAYVLTRKQSKNQRQKYRTTFLHHIEDHMQKFSQSGARKKKSNQNRHSSPFMTSFFKCVNKVCSTALFIYSKTEIQDLNIDFPKLSNNYYPSVLCCSVSGYTYRW